MVVALAMRKAEGFEFLRFHHKGFNGMASGAKRPIDAPSKEDAMITAIKALWKALKYGICRTVEAKLAVTADHR